MTEPKGRPTPKRSEAQRRRGGPVTTPPTNRREAAKQLRARQAEERQRSRQGTTSGIRGEDRALLPRDQGPVRRLVRDIIDSRRNLGGLLLPMAVVVFASGLTNDRSLKAAFLGIWLATLLGVAFDFLLLGLLIKKTLQAGFPKEAGVRGHIFYGILRSTVLRRLRMPKPQVRRGERP